MKTTKSLVKFDFDTAIIASLEAKYKDIQITDGKSYALVMAGLAEYRELRLAIDDKHTELKKDILEAGRGLDGDKNRLKTLLEPGENHLKEIRQVEDDRKAAIKAEKDRKERERIEAIQEKINNIQDLGIMLPNVSRLVIEERLIIVKAMQISQKTYMEFTEQALQFQKETVAGLETLLTYRIQSEKDEAERKAEAERLEAQKKEQAEAQAKIDEENRKVELRQHELEEQERKVEVRKAQQEFERQATIKAKQEAKDKAAQELHDRMQREAAEDKEKARQEALKPDKEKLIKFADELQDIEGPHVRSGKAITIVIETQGKLSDLAANIKKQAKEL